MVRVENRRGERRLIIDIRYTGPDGRPTRFRRDAEVQTKEAARAEDRRRLLTLATTGTPSGAPFSSTALPSPAALGEADVAEGARKRDVPTFREATELYVKTFGPTHLKPSTLFNYRKTLERFLVPRIGNLRLDEITPAVVRELDAEMVRRGAKPATRRQIVMPVRSLLRKFAVECGWLEEPPAMPAMPKAGRKIMHALTEVEFDKTLSASPPQHQLTFLLAGHAGLRAGEIRALKWRDVDLRAGQLIVRENLCRGQVAAPKSGHERVVPLTPELKAALERVQVRPRESYVSLNERGTCWTEYGPRQAFTRAQKKAGLEGWRFHDLRHYFVTALFRAGVAAPTVQALAGHAHLTTTQRYAHVARVDLNDAIAKLGALRL